MLDAKAGKGLFVWQTTAGAVIGFLVCVFVVYPPRCGWGDNKWGDVATWASAIGTFAAVAVALGIALRDARRQEERARVKSLIVMAHLAGEVMQAKRDLDMAAQHFDSAKKCTTVGAASVEITHAYAAIANIAFRRVEAIGDRLSDLDPVFAMMLAGANDPVGFARNDILSGINAPPRVVTVGDYCERFAVAFEQLGIVRGNLDRFLEVFEAHFVK